MRPIYFIKFFKTCSCFSIHGIHFLNSKVSQPYMENLILLWLLKMIPLCSAHSSTPCEFDFFCVAIWRYQPIVKLITKIERQWWSSENQSPLDGPVREYMYHVCNLSFIFESKHKFETPLTVTSTSIIRYPTFCRSKGKVL